MLRMFELYIVVMSRINSEIDHTGRIVHIGAKMGPMAPEWQ